MKFDWNYIIPALIPALISMVSLYLQIKQNKNVKCECHSSSQTFLDERCKKIIWGLCSGGI